MWKRCWMLIATMLICAGTACAETPGWAFEDEMFYHKLAYCGGQFGRENVSAEGRYPCPVCATDAKVYDDGLYAVERGGTVVVRITDEYMNRDWETEGFFGFYHWEQVGMEAYRTMCERYNGEDLLAMAAQFLSAEELKTQERTISLYPEYSEKRKEDVGFEMSRRRIDGCQYWCLHPTGNRKLKGEEIDWSITISNLSVGAGKYTFSDGDIAVKLPGVTIDKGSGEEELYYGVCDGLSVRILREMDTYICVVREYWADETLLAEVELHIEGSYAPILLNGYLDDTDGVFVCVLSEGEYQLISGGANVSLHREAWYGNAEYYGTEYAIAQKGTAGYGIIDREHDFVIEPRTDVRIYPAGVGQGSRSSRPPLIEYEVIEGDKSEALLNGETLEVIAEYRAKDGYRFLDVLNLAVYRIYREKGEVFEYRSTQDNSLLFERANEDDVTYNGMYQYVQDGLPQRLVAADEHGNWLTDNHGVKIEGTEYAHIMPLVWKAGKGVFFVADFEMPEDEWADHFPRYHNYNYGETLQYSSRDDLWRCGLIDQDGNIIAPVEYTSFTMISETQAVLGHRMNDIIVEF